jgi:hypothetical protein
VLLLGRNRTLPVPDQNVPTPVLTFCHSQEAATYDSKHEKTLAQIVEEIRSRLEFIGVDWVDDDESGDEEKNNTPKKQVKLLDYASGTGVSKFCPLDSWRVPPCCLDVKGKMDGRALVQRVVR